MKISAAALFATAFASAPIDFVNANPSVCSTTLDNDVVKAYTNVKVFVQSGEVSESTAIVMARCNSEEDSKVLLRVNSTDYMEDQVFSAKDYTISFELDGLKSDSKYNYKVFCTSLATGQRVQSRRGFFKTAPPKDSTKPLKFVWAADLAGQGWGRNPDFSVQHVETGEMIEGGYVVFQTMEMMEPDFALFQGDMIYPDNSIPASKPIPDAIGGGTWVNDPAKDFVASTLDEFRANWKYNFGDRKLVSFLAKTPIFVQWDDHEVTNNWWPDEVIGSPQYEDGTAVNSLYHNSLQAFYEFNPLVEGQSIYRKQQFGAHLEIFFVDYRSFRDPNPENSNPEGADMMGEEQLEWLKQSLLESEATWKIISSHDPFGIVTGGPGDRDSFGQEDPAILGRELEFQDLISFIMDEDIKNVISLTSDVHFTGHVNMSPDRAEGGFTDFKPFDEYVIGPIHAGSFGPNFLDTSFGAQYEFELGPLTLGFERFPNFPPTEFNLQSFGYAEVSETGELTIQLIGIDGDLKYEVNLMPEV